MEVTTKSNNNKTNIILAQRELLFGHVLKKIRNTTSKKIRNVFFPARSHAHRDLRKPTSSCCVMSHTLPWTISTARETIVVQKIPLEIIYGNIKDLFTCLEGPQPRIACESKEDFDDFMHDGVSFWHKSWGFFLLLKIDVNSRTDSSIIRWRILGQMLMRSEFFVLRAA